MDDMVGVVFAFGVSFFVGELALVEVVEEAVVGHDVGGIEGTLYGLLDQRV